MDFIFVDRPGIVPAVIRLFDGGPFSHCGVLPFGFQHEGSRLVDTSFEDGVRMRSVGSLMFASTRVEILRLQLPDEAAASQWAVDQVGVKYDFGALAALAVRGIFGAAPRSDRADRLYCVEHLLRTCVVGGLRLEQPTRFHGVRAGRQQLLDWGAQQIYPNR